MGIGCHYFLTLLPTYSWLSYGNFCLHCTVVETVKETKDDKQGHELSSNLLLVECVSETGEKPGCLEVDKQISVIVGGTRFVLESYGVRVDSLGDRKNITTSHTVFYNMFNCQFCALCLPTRLCYGVLDKQKVFIFNCTHCYTE